MGLGTDLRQCSWLAASTTMPGCPCFCPIMMSASLIQSYWGKRWISISAALHQLLQLSHELHGQRCCRSIKASWPWSSAPQINARWQQTYTSSPGISVLHSAFRGEVQHVQRWDYQVCPSSWSINYRIINRKRGIHWKQNVCVHVKKCCSVPTEDTGCVVVGIRAAQKGSVSCQMIAPERTAL